MKHLSEQAQQVIVKKAINRNGQSLLAIAKSSNIGYSTLQKWIKRYRNSDQFDTVKTTDSNSKINHVERFQHLVSTSTLDEAALGAYCRKHGLYSYQLKQWKDAFMSKQPEKKSHQELSELKALRAENKLLKQELRRKDSALAETTALLVLKKKANLIWGTDEEV